MWNMILAFHFGPRRCCGIHSHHQALGCWTLSRATWLAFQHNVNKINNSLSLSLYFSSHRALITYFYLCLFGVWLNGAMRLNCALKNPRTIFEATKHTNQNDTKFWCWLEMATDLTHLHANITARYKRIIDVAQAEESEPAFWCFSHVIIQFI